MPDLGLLSMSEVVNRLEAMVDKPCNAGTLERLCRVLSIQCISVPGDGGIRALEERYLPRQTVAMRYGTTEGHQPGER